MMLIQPTALYLVSCKFCLNNKSVGPPLSKPLSVGPPRGEARGAAGAGGALGAGAPGQDWTVCARRAALAISSRRRDGVDGVTKQTWKHYDITRTRWTKVDGGGPQQRNERIN
ncbi:unnamed protein product [Euphydryas editha]|uniref:Uncharacterized protein n=1 Tax=Euphydryas editha TaxID=104508 RepID=A0AAU9TV68_EUPED|nr:unnamed protein product [Euphydryas editha]